MAEGFGNKFVSWTQNIVKEIKEIPAKNNGNFYGVGINLALVATASASYNVVAVDSVEPAGPAAKAGLQRGDIIVEVDSKQFDDGKVYLPDDVAAVIRGPEGTQVDVIVERDGKRVEFVLTRKPIGVVSPPASPSRNKCEKKEDVVAKSKGQSDKKQEVGDVPKKEKAQVSATMAAVPNVIDSLHSLSLSEEEHKEKDLASSAEDADQFDGSIGNCCNILGNMPLPRTNSIDEASEEKTDNEISSIINSVGDESQWEMISERSGSAVVISFSGSISGASFRSASPSVLKNRYVLTEATGEPYIYHVVLPTDTLPGILLAYKISATRLRMENNFSGNSIQMAPKKLKIPIKTTKGMMIRTQDTTSREYKLYAFVAEMPTMELVEAKAYLDLSTWDLDEALRSAREDEGWSLKGGGFEPPVAVSAGELSPMLSAVAKPKALTFDGAGFELKDIKRES